MATSSKHTTSLLALDLEQMQDLVQRLDLEPFRARQIFSWVHNKGVTSHDQMTNISKAVRQQLTRLTRLETLELDRTQRAEDGTRKLRLRCADGALIETVLIPEADKVTQCLSSQVGCGLGCSFCSTAALGLRRNLTVAEVVDQVYRGRAALAGQGRLTNLVFMGMGEPMNNLDTVLAAVKILCTDLGANFSPRRITLSTAGVIPGIEALGRRMPQLGLAVSLNATTEAVRSRLMPVNRRHALAALLAALRRYPLPRRRRITIEYVLLRGINDSLSDARRLPGLLDKIRAKINLIAFNPAPGEATFQRPDPDQVEAFAEVLRDRGFTTVVRRSRGADIAAACGQLAGEGPTAAARQRRRPE